MSLLLPPTGGAPTAFEVDDRRIDIAELSEELRDLYYEIFPDDLERYGEAGLAWCDHGSRYLLACALEDARTGSVDTVAQINWLARMLDARGFPMERMTCHIELACALVDRAVPGPLGARAARRLEVAADSVSCGGFRR